MKFFMALCALIFVGVAGWQMGGRLSSDAIGMALGVLFGVMAGIPAALMVLAAQRSSDSTDNRRDRSGQRQSMSGYPQLPQQPPVIVVTGNGAPMMNGGGYEPSRMQTSPVPPAQPQLPGPVDNVPQRQFRVIGDSEETIDRW